MNAAGCPDHWQLVELNDLRAEGPYTFVGGPFGSDLTQRDYVAQPGVPVIRGTNLGGAESRFVDDNFVYVNEAKASALSRNMAYPGDVVFTQRGTLGQVAVIPTASKFPRYVISQSQMKLTPDDRKVDRRFLYRYLRAPQTLNRLLSQTQATGVPHINLGILKRFPIALPSLPEQRRIAEVLDRAEALRAKRRAALAQLDTLPQAIFLDMFGDPATNPKGWPIIPFGEIGENQDSLRVPVKASDRDQRNGPFAYYGASGIIDFVDQFIFDGDRLLVAEDGANLVSRTTPIAFIARGQYWVNNHAHVIAENGRADLQFLEVFLESTDLKPFVSGTAQPKLNRSNLDRLPTLLPPIKLQRDFAGCVAKVGTLKTTHRAFLAQLDALFASLQHRAFRGEL